MPSAARRSTPPTLAMVTQALAARFGNRFVTSSEVCRQHGHTLSLTPNQPPDAVVWPQDEAEMVWIVKLCAAHDVPVIPFGTGTSLEGHVNAPHGGICARAQTLGKCPSPG